MGKKKTKSTRFSWCIAYISTAFIETIQRELNEHEEFSEIEAYIPTVKILKKKSKGHNRFEYVPLLFNYGFFKIPRNKAISASFLAKLKEKVTCIYGWVSDTNKILWVKPVLKANNKFIYTDKNVPVATASNKEIANLIRISSDISVHSKDNIDELKEGMYVTLRGYPWDGLLAKILKIYPNKKEIKVEGIIIQSSEEKPAEENVLKIMKLSFDTICYTVYRGKAYDDTVEEYDRSLDEMKNPELDKVQFQQFNEEEHGFN